MILYSKLRLYMKTICFWIS